jgi:tellurite resistance protein
MFLQNVPQKYKKLFMDLAYTMMGIDGKYEDEEKLALRSCQEELGLTQYLGSTIDLDDTNLLLVQDRTLRAEMYFELLGIALSDSEYSEEELGAMKKIQKAWEIPTEFDKTAQEIIRNINRNYARACILLSQF